VLITRVYWVRAFDGLEHRLAVDQNQNRRNLADEDLGRVVLEACGCAFRRCSVDGEIGEQTIERDDLGPVGERIADDLFEIALRRLRARKGGAVDFEVFERDHAGFFVHIGARGESDDAEGFHA